MTKSSGGFIDGVIGGIPICLGYLSVSFGFGIMAVGHGLSVFEATMISLTNLTSAGQAAGVEVIASGGSLIEMALVQLTINLRYALMALSLSQKLEEGFGLPRRMVCAYGITDEIFGVCAAREGRLRPAFMYGIILISTVGWVLGTLLGAAAGSIMPGSVTAALGILLYGMFLALIVPPAKKEKSILLVVIGAAVLSIICRYLIPGLSSGFAVMICGAAASAAGAILFPREEAAE